MRSILRVLYIFVGPLFAFAIGSFIVCFLAVKLMPDDPMQEQITTSLNAYIDKKPQNIVYLFNDNVFVTLKSIKKGETIEVGDLERQDYGATHISHPRAKYVTEHVSGQVAARDIPKGTPLSPEDFAPSKAEQKPAAKNDDQVACASHKEHPLTWVFYSIPSLAGWAA